jgi:chromosome segregation ATPase
LLPQSTLTDQATATADKLTEMQVVLSQTQSDYELIRSQFDELKTRYEDINAKVSTLETEKDSIQEKYLSVKAERNTMKQKADSLAKEISRMIQENASLQTEVQSLHADKHSLSKELVMETMDEECESSSIADNENTIPSLEEHRRVLDQKAELERMVKELTEYVSAKESQLDTMKDVNRQLTEELQNVARSRRMPVKPLFDKESKSISDGDRNKAKTENLSEALSKVIEERDSIKNELVRWMFFVAIKLYICVLTELPYSIG